MKATHLFFALLLFVAGGLLFSACEDCITGNGKSETRYMKAGEITEIKLSTEANIILVRDTTDSIRMVGESNILEALELEIRGNSLKVRNEGCIRQHEPVNIYVPVNTIESLIINGSGDITTDHTLKASGLDLNVNGSGDILIAVESNDITSKINGSGDIKLSGAAKNHRIMVNGSGNVESTDLATSQTGITINGSGDCRVTVTSALNVVIRGSGSVYYKGTPDISTEVKGSGSVEKLN